MEAQNDGFGRLCSFSKSDFQVPAVSFRGVDTVG